MSDLPDFGLIEKAVGFVFRPMLKITHRGERKIEEVSISYPLGHYHPLHSHGSTATVTITGDRLRHGRAKYIRAWVYSEFGTTAKGCRVFIERIWHDDILVDDERSPLHWADLDGIYQLSDMPRGYRRGHYIDICAADSVDQRLQIISQKGLKGYHRFDKSGIYRLELSAEAANPHCGGHLLLYVRYDGNWESMRVLSTREGSRFLPWHSGLSLLRGD